MNVYSDDSDEDLFQFDYRRLKVLKKDEKCEKKTWNSMKSADNDVSKTWIQTIKSI